MSTPLTEVTTGPYLPVAGGGALLVAVVVLMWLSHRRGRLAAQATGQSPAGPRPPRDGGGARRGEDRLTFVVAALATAVAAQGMWKFFTNVLGFPIELRVMVFCFLELAMFTSALRARRNLSDPHIGSAGVDGIAVWVLTGLSAVLSAMDSATIQEAVFRLAAPLVAAWLWERGMSIQRRRNGTSAIHWRITPERVLVRLGVAEASDRTATDVDAHRRLNRVARAAKQVRALRAAGARAGRLRRVERRLDQAMESAVEHAGLATDPDRQRALIAQIGALFHAGTLADLDAAAPWTLTVQLAEPVTEAPHEVPAVRADDAPHVDTRTDGPHHAARTAQPRMGVENGSAARAVVTRTDRAEADDVDRGALVAELAGQMHAAAESGDRWRPDYTDLRTRTQRGQRWCEYVVRDARNTFADGYRTDGDPHDADGPAPATRTEDPHSAGAPAPATRTDNDPHTDRAGDLAVAS